MSIFNNFFGAGQTDETPEFTALLEECLESLRFMTTNHSAWRIEQAERWDLDQDVGELVFTFPDGVVKAPAQIIGTFDTTTSMWMWAWANPSIDETLTRDALQVLDYGRRHRIARLTTETWKGEEMDGWYMTALATCLCRANGGYRGPTDTTFVFMTFGRVTGSLFDGKLVIDVENSVAYPAPDFSHVTSMETVMRLVSEGKLIKLLLLPKKFSGADIPENTVYVPPAILKIQDQISREILPLVEKGLDVHFGCEPEYKEDSFVPAKIHYQASHPETNWHFERTIDIW